MQSGRVKQHVAICRGFAGETHTFMRRRANRNQRHKANIAVRVLLVHGAFEEV